MVVIQKFDILVLIVDTLAYCDPWVIANICSAFQIFIVITYFLCFNNPNPNMCLNIADFADWCVDFWSDI